MKKARKGNVDIDGLLGAILLSFLFLWGLPLMFFMFAATDSENKKPSSEDSTEIYYMKKLMNEVIYYETILQNEGIVIDTNNTYMSFENGQLEPKGSDGKIYRISTETKNSQIKISSSKSQEINCFTIDVKNDSLDEEYRVLHYDSCNDLVPTFANGTI